MEMGIKRRRHKCQSIISDQLSSKELLRIPDSHNFKMVQIAGKFTFGSQDNFDKYLEAAGESLLQTVFMSGYWQELQDSQVWLEAVVA